MNAPYLYVTVGEKSAGKPNCPLLSQVLSWGWQWQLTEGDTVGLTGEVTMAHDDSTVTIHLHGYVYQPTLRAEHLSLVAKATA